MGHLTRIRVTAAAVTAAVATTAVALALAALACRDDVGPFEADRPGAPVERLGRFTFSVLDDRSPAWSATGDSIYYSARGGFGGLPADSGVLVGLPFGSQGTVAPLLPDLQTPDDPEQAWLVTPAVAPGGERLAFVEIAALWSLSTICQDGDIVQSCDPPRGGVAPFPPLRQIVIHSRPLTSDAAVGRTLSLDVEGVVLDETRQPFAGLPGVWVVHDYPFQQIFVERRAFAFRPSWAPDGDRLVFSDGVRLLIWQMGADEPVPIPGTQDGVTPAWSPDGEWIAFSRLPRADSINHFCIHPGAFVPCAVQDRTDYELGQPQLTLIRPGGDGVSVLGTGTDPAWSPDGGSLYFHRADAIWQAATDGSSAAPVPGTADGREPAVSPDGRFLAFSRLSANGDYDIWVIALEPSS